MRAGRQVWSGSRVRQILVTGVAQGVLFALYLYALSGDTWWHVALGGTFFAVCVTVLTAPLGLRKGRTDQAAVQAAVQAAFRWGQPIAPELAPALLEYCGTRAVSLTVMWASSRRGHLRC